jgi:hypothetical protein
MDFGEHDKLVESLYGIVFQDSWQAVGVCI